MYGWLEQVAVLIQLGIFLGLLYYAIETYKIRKVSQQQNETMQRPCLVPSVRVRDDFDTAVENLSGNPYPGYRLVYDESDTSHVVLHNIGSGPAFNIRHEVQSPKGVKKDNLSGYLPYIRREGGESILLVASNLTSENRDTDVVFKLSYESLGGHRYESEMCIETRKNEPVVTDYKFRF